MANNFIEFFGNNVGKSIKEKDCNLILEEIISLAKKEECKIIYPEDVNVSKDLNGSPQIKELNEILSDEMILDIGPKTIEKINAIYEKSNNDLYFLESYVEGLDVSQENFTGNYSNIPIENLPDEFLSKIEQREAPFLFYPDFLSNGSIILIYLYDKNPPQKPSLESSFDYIAALAKEHKAKMFLDDWLTTSKKNVYINIFEQ